MLLNEVFRTMHLRRTCLFLSVLCCFGVAVSAADVQLQYDAQVPQIAFAAQRLARDLKRRGHNVVEQDAQLLVRLQVAPAGKAAESFAITRPAPGQIVISGQDAAGAMYGGLEAAELIRIGDLDAVVPCEQSPHMAMRGTKFNIPLDVRTPSYTDPCDAAQQNIAEMWSFEFWQSYIDCLAEHRYNFISLWNLHPFPSLVKVPGYEDVALDDVQRSTAKWQENYSLSGTGFDAPEILEHVETLKRLTIDQKIDFWRRVMRYGKQRNVDFYVVTWNTFVNGTGGNYGLTDALDNPTTVDYFRKSVCQMFLTYPDLAGIGLTSGENMPTPGRSGRAARNFKEDWLFATYGQGVLDAAAAMPGRHMTLIHRQHMSGALEIADRFARVRDHQSVRFLFSFKYAQAHVMSCTRQPFHEGFVRELGSQGAVKTIWTLRNDDNYYFRWGAPDFVREFLQNIPQQVTEGFYYGSDQYVWGRELLSRNPQQPRELELQKHWYHWLLWGRLGYNPQLSNDRIVAILHTRFPQIDAQQLFAAWQCASMIYPLTTGFHWGSLDFQWYIEGCKSRPEPAQTASGFHDVNRFITLPPHPSTGYVSIPDFVAAQRAGRPIEGVSPIDVSQQIHAQADQALALLESLDAGSQRDLQETLVDIRSMACLGKYYAHKIRGATELALYRDTQKPEHQQRSITELARAAEYWKQYMNSALSIYKNPLWTNRVGYVDWQQLYQYVLEDIQIASE